MSIKEWTIANQKGMRARISNLGAALIGLELPDRNGQRTDLVLGYEDLSSYWENPPCLGALVAPNANRIAGARFTLDDKDYSLEKNDGENNLHSGSRSLHHRLWDLISYKSDCICLSIQSPHMDLQLPGNLTLTVSYRIREDNALIIDYQGQCDQRSLFNPTNHSYFNLAGHDQGSILEQELWIDANYFTWADPDSIPRGEIRPVSGTPMDFRTPKPIGQDIDTPYEQLLWAGGYDHNWVLQSESGQLRTVASLYDPKSGRKMTVSTDLPGIQIYTGNGLGTQPAGKGGCHYGPRAGVCFETQYFPNAINVSHFASPLIEPGIAKTSRTVFSFDLAAEEE